MFKYIPFIIYGISLILLSGCAARLEIVSLNDGAFIEENLPVSIDTKNSSYPFLAEAIKTELELQIKKDGFTVNEQNTSYRLSIELLSYDKSIYRRYEPVYDYSNIRCISDKECYRIPTIVYIPCLNISKSIHVMIGAFNVYTNKTKEFLLTDKKFADNCHYGFGSLYSFNSDILLSNSLKQESIISLAKKIKYSLFPTKTVRKEKLLDEIKSTELSQNEMEIFKKSYEMASGKKYEEAIFGFEQLKQLMDNKTPQEVYMNLGLLHEYIGNLDEALRNYEYLSNAEEYKKRVQVKKRYEKK
jgi:tetratricopeptide (TPR) repeat protein